MQYDDVVTNPRWRTDAILKIVFLAISRRHIDRLMRNLDRKYRFTCQYRAHDQNCNFRKFKMADGRHFDNSFIAAVKYPISIKFGTHRCKFPFRAWELDKKSEIFQIQDGGRTPY